MASLRISKIILLMLAFFFLLGTVAEFFDPGSTIFDGCKMIIPSIATFVIGFTFGQIRTKKNRH